jgi:hypothetical protein
LLPQSEPVSTLCRESTRIRYGPFEAIVVQRRCHPVLSDEVAGGPLQPNRISLCEIAAKAIKNWIAKNGLPPVFSCIAYRLQADRFGDLDHETKQVLDRTVAKETGPGMSARLASFDQKRTELTPGTVLVREWDRQSQRVMVMADGFAWNGQTYDSLSKVAFAITGTRWNGPRFFGLRDRDDRSTMGARP